MLIQAVLSSKASGYDSEDILTSTVFGTLKYLRPDIVLIPFLELAFLYNEDKTALWQTLKSEGVELRCYREIEYIFWPRNISYGEPDLIILFKNHIHGDDDYLLVIEVKLKSEKSGIEDKDQLVRYYEAIVNDIENFSEPSISSFNGKKGHIIYLTQTTSHSEINASLKLLENKYEIIKNQLFHLRWQQLFKTFENMKEFCSDIEERIIDDLIKYLDKLGLRDFSGISLPHESLVEEFLLQRPVFYRDTLANKEKKTFFDNLDIELSHEGIIFYREEQI